MCIRDRLQPLLEATRLTATQALLDRDRGTQVDCYVRMLELGVAFENLGHGRTVLRQEARVLIDRAVESYDLADRLRAAPGSDSDMRAEMSRLRVDHLELAEDLLVAAIGFDPDFPETHHRLGEVYFALGSFDRAAREWEAVLTLMEREPLAGAVHLNVARAWREHGDLDRARATCQRYLSDSPGGEWVEQTEEMLRRL